MPPYGEVFAFAKVKFLQSEVFRYTQSEVCPLGKLLLTQITATTSLRHRCNFTLLHPTSGWLLSFEAIATGAAFRITATRIPYVDFTERAVIPCAVILTFRNATTNARVHFLYIFVHHNKKTSFSVRTVWVNLRKIIDIFKNFLYNILE